MVLAGPGNGSRQFFTVASNSTLTIAGKLSGTTGAELTKEGTGTLILPATTAASPARSRSTTVPASSRSPAPPPWAAAPAGHDRRHRLPAADQQRQGHHVSENLILNGRRLQQHRRPAQRRRQQHLGRHRHAGQRRHAGQHRRQPDHLRRHQRPRRGPQHHQGRRRHRRPQRPATPTAAPRRSTTASSTSRTPTPWASPTAPPPPAPSSTAATPKAAPSQTRRQHHRLQRVADPQRRPASGRHAARCSATPATTSGPATSSWAVPPPTAATSRSTSPTTRP